MKNSLWFKLFIGLMIFLLLTFALMVVLNTTYLEKYYLNEKVKSITKFVNEVDNEFNGSIDEIQDKLLEVENKTIGSVNIFNSYGELEYTSSNNNKLLLRLVPLSIGKYKKRVQMALRNDQSLFFPFENEDLNIKSYVMVKPLSKGYYMIVVSPVEQITESISIMNRFNYYTMCFALVIGLILASIYAKLFTKPIIKLNSIAKKMINLDFSERFKSTSGDEISQLGDTINTLSTKLNSTINELNTANNKLKRDIIIEKKHEEQRKELISNISHELKTPIALIQGYGEGLRESVITEPKDMDYYCDVIVDEAQKMNKLVMELLELSHIESGFYNLDISEFDLCLLTSAILSKYKDIFGRKDINPILYCSTDIININADMNRIERVIKNLLNNAIDHVDDSKEIKISIIKDQDDSILFKLYNSGNNIPDDVAENIWSSFYKADKARTRELGGTGLGLSITKGILNLHNFDFGLNNEVHGVTFWFKINRPE